MKLVWCPDTASKAYIDTVKLCEPIEETAVAELVSAMAGGWKPQLIVETWRYGGPIATSIGLAVASRHTGGRHVCVVEDERSRFEYEEAMHRAGLSTTEVATEVVVGEVEEVMGTGGGLVGIDFLVLDSRRKDAARVLRLAKFSQRGAVLVCKNATSPRSNLGVRWRAVVESGARVVRSAYLPVGNGLEIAYVGAPNGGSIAPVGKAKGSLGGGGGSRWVRHVDQAGEEHVFRR